MKLGRHFSLAELCRSQTAVRRGLDNFPAEREIDCLRDLVVNILDPLRTHLARPVVVSSGYRSPKLNTAIGGSATSQHCLGQAADIIVPGMSAVEVFEAIRKLNLPFDQLIEEFGDWTHVSYGPRQRRQCLLARRQGGKTVYIPAGAHS